MTERSTKGSPAGVGVSLVMGMGLVVLLLWVARGDVMGDGSPVARAADPVRPTVEDGDVHCVALEGGGPYPGCDQVFTGMQDAVDAASVGEIIDCRRCLQPSGGSLTQVVYADKAVTTPGSYALAVKGGRI